MTKIQICFVIFFTKNEKDFFKKRVSLKIQIYAIMNQNKHKHNNTQSLSLFQQFACIKKIIYVSKKDTNKFFNEKNSDLHLMKMQIHFYFE